MVIEQQHIFHPNIKVVGRIHVLQLQRQVLLYNSANTNKINLYVSKHLIFTISATHNLKGNIVRVRSGVFFQHEHYITHPVHQLTD